MRRDGLALLKESLVSLYAAMDSDAGPKSATTETKIPATVALPTVLLRRAILVLKKERLALLFPLPAATEC